MLGEPLPIRHEDFTDAEVAIIVNKCRQGKAPGPDDIPAEYYQVVAKDPQILQWLVEFVNRCWQGGDIPKDWHLAHVSTLYKKGAVDMCENYRPISLLSLGYKVFAALVRQRLVEAGAEGRLSKTQFGFRSGCGTMEAIFVLRRKVEMAAALKMAS
jgi:hypothetical protein